MFAANAALGRTNGIRKRWLPHRALEHIPIMLDHFAPRLDLPAVIAGLDPAIHLSGEYPWDSGPPDQVRG